MDVLLGCLRKNSIDFARGSDTRFENQLHYTLFDRINHLAKSVERFFLIFDKGIDVGITAK